jgi:hypothetical protein
MQKPTPEENPTEEVTASLEVGSLCFTPLETQNIPSGEQFSKNEFLGICVPLAYYEASIGNFLLTFRDKLSVPSSGLT